ncbi:UNVERIFIED_ORG: hypothetical protein B2H98_16445 [Clostridium botulinum]
MVKDKIIIDLNGYIQSHVLVDENSNILYSNFEITENMKIVTMYYKSFIIPKWDFYSEEWVEEATEEEIEQWEEINKPKPKEPSKDEVLLSNIMLKNATLKQKTNDLEKMTANLMLQIAELKGGNTNA